MLLNVQNVKKSCCQNWQKGNILTSLNSLIFWPFVMRCRYAHFSPRNIITY